MYVIILILIILFFMFKGSLSSFGAMSTGSTAAPTINYTSTTKSGSFSGLNLVSLFQGDTIQWPSNFFLTEDEAVTFNWFMNQDAINTYMSDKAMDVVYARYRNPATKVIGVPSNTTSLNPQSPDSAPNGWNGPYITQPIASIVLGQAPVNLKGNVSTSLITGGGNGASKTPNSGVSATNYRYTNLLRTSNITTVLNQYTNLYNYIISCMNRIGMGAESSPNLTPKVTFNTTGSFNDGIFYSDYTGLVSSPNSGINNIITTDYKLSIKLYKGIINVLQARQNQINNRLTTSNLALY
jgi:hypothetical protein